MTQILAEIENRVEGIDGIGRPTIGNGSLAVRPFPAAASRPSAPTTVIVGLGRVSLLIVGWHLALAAAFYLGLKMV